MKSKYEKLFRQALKAGSERDYQKALCRYSSAVKMLKLYISYENESPKGYFFLGRTYLALEYPRKAARYFIKSLSYSPDNPEILSLLGISFMKMKKINAAVSVLEKAVEIHLQPVLDLSDSIF